MDTYETLLLVWVVFGILGWNILCFKRIFDALAEISSKQNQTFTSHQFSAFSLVKGLIGSLLLGPFCFVFLFMIKKRLLITND
jgi:hypothetical protein